MKMVIGSIESPARSSYMFCRKLRESDDGEGPSKGTCAILFSKDDEDTYDLVMNAIQSVGEKKFGDKYRPTSKKYRNPLQDGDELCEDEDFAIGEEAKGMWFLSTSCYSVPQVVNTDVERIIDPEELDEVITSGNYFLFSIEFKSYDNESKGVRAQLNNLMFVKEGERLDGKSSAESDFGQLAKKPKGGKKRRRRER